MDIKKIVKGNYDQALKHIHHTPDSMDHFITRVTFAVEKNMYVLTRQEYDAQVKEYDGYIEENDVGRWVWDEGECYVGQETLELWVHNTWEQLKEFGGPAEHTNFQDYVLEASILDVMQKRNKVKQ